MKLSEAIRLGAMLGPQEFGVLNKVRGLFRKREATCALGAAFKAAGCGSHEEIETEPRFGFRGSQATAGKTTVIEIPDEWYPVFNMHAACPACSDFTVSGPVKRIVAIHLNDIHHWTREQIADWVATLEARIEALQNKSEHTTELARDLR